MARRPSWRVVAVVLVALVGLATMAAVVAEDEPGSPEPASRRFLDAWRRSREATFLSVAEFSRTSNSTGAELSDRIVVAQRPPDRVFVDGDGASGLVEGRRIACTYREQALDCQDVAAGRTYEQDVDRQLATLEGYVTGESPLYRVTALARDDRLGDCFELVLEDPALVAPPLGTRAHHCFDPDTGAPVLARIDRVEADDETRTVELSTEVGDAELDPRLLAARR